MRRSSKVRGRNFRLRQLQFDVAPKLIELQHPGCAHMKEHEISFPKVTEKIKIGLWVGQGRADKHSYFFYPIRFRLRWTRARMQAPMTSFLQRICAINAHNRNLPEFEAFYSKFQGASHGNNYIGIIYIRKDTKCE